jgi:hypothetical protein
MKNIALTLIGAAFVGLTVLLMASGAQPWTSPDPWTVLLFFGGCAVVGAIDTAQSRWPPKPEVSEAGLVLRYNRVRMGGFAIASVAWLAAGMLGLFGGVLPVWLAWLLIPFAGLAVAVFVPTAIDGRAKVVVDADGIADYRSLKKKISWSDVSAVQRSFRAGVPAVTVRLANPRTFLEQRTALGRMLGRKINPIDIVDLPLDGTLYDLWQAIERFAPAHLSSAARRWTETDENDEAL